MEIFIAEKVAEMKSDSDRKCRMCGQKLELVRTILDRSGKLFRMFECECGERVWDD
jgi:hypothetical protein